jgi:hypothetical protein
MDGARVRSVNVPARQPTSPTFAGRNLDRLLETTADEGMDDDEKAGDPEHGRTLLVDVGVRGPIAPPHRPDCRFKPFRGGTSSLPPASAPAASRSPPRSHPTSSPSA